jgi:hypothetical protein
MLRGPRGQDGEVNAALSSALIPTMQQTGPHDLAQVRLDNALALFEEFVRMTARHADAATLRGLERRFAERVQIQPSYWSQIKGRSRQIGERLARQFEQLCHKPHGWMDVAHGSAVKAAPPTGGGTREGTAPDHESVPRDDDERFIVGLVLTYYRRHPQRARARLLDLLGEVLTPPPDGPQVSGSRPSPSQALPKPAAEPADLWQRTQAGVAPLKRKR